MVIGGQEAAAPETGEDRLAGILAGPLGDHGDESRQVGVLGAEPIAGPGAHAGIARLLVAGVQERDRRVVVDGLGVQGLDDADVIRDGLDVRDEVTDPGAMLAAGLAFHERGPDRVALLSGSHPGEALGAFDRGRQVFAGKLVQGGLVVEQVDVGHAAGLEEAEDPFSLGGEMRNTA